MNALRLFKALRPLRALQRIRGMRVLVNCILAAIPQLCTVVVFLMFVLSVFGIIGVQLFKGSLRHQCHGLLLAHLVLLLGEHQQTCGQHSHAPRRIPKGSRGKWMQHPLARRRRERSKSADGQVSPCFQASPTPLCFRSMFISCALLCSSRSTEA